MVARNHNEFTAAYPKFVCKNQSVILDLAANDYIEVFGYIGRASNMTLHFYGDDYQSTHFLGYKIA